MSTHDRSELAALFQSAVGDAERTAALARRVWPTAERLQAALQSKDVADSVGARYASMRPDDDNARDWMKVLRLQPDRTVVDVFPATGAQLADPDGPRALLKHFPNGALQIAHHLRPDVTFYEVTCVAPGKDSGSRLHLFFWDGQDWCMGGPLWRSID